MGGKGLIAVGAPPVPSWIIFIKGAIIVLSLIILALSAYALSIYPYGPPGFMVFLAIISWIIYGLSIGLELKANQFYYRIGFFVAKILAIIFWLSGWAYSASWASIFTSSWYGSSVYGSVNGALAGLGALTWILVIVEFVFFTIGCTRDDGSAAANNVELGQNKEGPHVQAAPQSIPQQQPYGEQPQYAQQPVYAQQPQYAQQPAYGAQPTYQQPQ